jgi:catecholate siderophore receptor
LMFGAEFGREEYLFQSKNSTGVSSIAIFSPVVTATVGGGRANDLNGTLATDRLTEADTYAGYVLDQFEITSQWKLLAGARYDVFSAEQDDRTRLNEDFEHTDQEWSPRAGLVWQPSDTQSYYLSFGSSFNPSAEGLSLAVASANLAAETNYN